ncbi:MAG: FecR family protein [Lacinutrix sp.]|uniref:FecR family protein n=1 Tax=Lacinutrix sp. TaxID=1937692 RepID=UPI0030A5BFF3
MKRKVLIKKWLDNELNSEDLEAFKQLKDYTDLVRLSHNTMLFKPENIDISFELESLNFALKTRKQKGNNYFKPLLRVAAILAISLSLFYYTTTLNTNINTEIAQKENVVLPDQSLVVLNAKSTLTYNKSKWENNRDLNLNGEAYFKVAKGSKFSVKTNTGTISVLGTEFNVKNRKDLFEVICYEGSVKVEHNNKTNILKPGENFLLLNNIVIEKPKAVETSPYWINNETDFTSMPYTQVISEFERQYNVTFSVDNIDTNQLFTGSFSHNNIEVALQAITFPLNLKYTKNNNKISLQRE